MPDSETRQAILDAAQELVQTLGVNGMSYQHISEAVGIRKASIHYHFPSKQDLIEALVQRYSGAFLGAVDEILASSSAPPAKLRRYCRLFEGPLQQDSGRVCLCGMLGAELASLGHPAVAQVRSFYRENERRLGELLEEGREDGSFAFTGSPRDLAALLFSLLEGALVTVRADGGVRQFRAITRQFMNLTAA